VRPCFYGIFISNPNFILADIFKDREFAYLQGNELLSVFRNAVEHYTINLSKLLRYADRKGKKEEIRSFIVDHRLAVL
jgi:hypothetical protein